MNVNDQSMPATKRVVLNNVFFIGLISFFGGISQDLIIPILPLYLANVLHLDKSFIGLSEGLVTSSASIFKIVSGHLSDRFRSRKSIVFIGYLLSLIGTFCCYSFVIFIPNHLLHVSVLAKSNILSVYSYWFYRFWWQYRLNSALTLNPSPNRPCGTRRGT